MYILHTDGSCPGKPGPGPGGIGVYLEFPDNLNLEAESVCKGYKMTTNNRMELRAGIEGLRLVEKRKREHKNYARVAWYTDSEYVKKGAFQVPTWRKYNAWEKSNAEIVQNQDLWRQLEAVRSRLGVYPTWISREQNQEADDLARKAARSPLWDDLGYIPPKVGRAVGADNRGVSLLEQDNDKFKIRVYRKDRPRERQENGWKIRFQICNEDGTLSKEKYYMYASPTIEDKLPRNNTFMVKTRGRNIIKVIKQIINV